MPRDDRHIVGTGRDDEFDDDALSVSCEMARDLISAAADDALGGSETELLDRHVDGCAACSAYQLRVTSLTRATRVRSASFDPGFVDTVMARSQPARLGRGGWMRPALAWCGVLLVWQSITPLVFGELDGTPTHIARHVGASTAALAVGLLYAAWRPQRAAGLLPFVGALFGAMLAGAVFDVLGGDRSPVAELVHVVEFTGMVLLWMIAGSPGRERIERMFTFGRRGAAVPTS